MGKLTANEVRATDVTAGPRSLSGYDLALDDLSGLRSYRWTGLAVNKCQ